MRVFFGMRRVPTWEIKHFHHYFGILESSQLALTRLWLHGVWSISQVCHSNLQISCICLFGNLYLLAARPSFKKIVEMCHIFFLAKTKKKMQGIKLNQNNSPLRIQDLDFHCCYPRLFSRAFRLTLPLSSPKKTFELTILGSNIGFLIFSAESTF